MSSTSSEDYQENSSSNEEMSNNSSEGEEKLSKREERSLKQRKMKRTKQKVLFLPSRGITTRQRHLMKDLISLIPHYKKDSKLKAKNKLKMINEICQINSCNNCLFFESRKNNELYLWAAKVPRGPSIRFHVLNIHTMSELNMIGNCLNGSRPILTFDKAFDSQPHYKLAKELFCQIFATPKRHPCSKPFVDHTLSFTLINDKIWFRNYQIIWKDPKVKDSETRLVEIGPRFVLKMVRIMAGSFSGVTIYKDGAWVSPNEKRIQLKKEKQQKYQKKLLERQKQRKRKTKNILPKNELQDVFKD
ncbi:ribosome biogenesis protein brx1 [Anaeramoeba flamelloides]|uniref:Ribosome biogenesis protein brx1 n=1 Tax=Anaeramoeba flamelloides TaxID=1746091 RepID=A0AAV7ZLV9_9EUKA|nr:ribosome biogenesis protein brx1 [Anaeramoeba flamelloides]KAJ6233038.1 ribosome biogenesis protein brx1 [Anaeramoeba flamelloides]KAJ6250137.1 ribosome biogenesis protein brx1 [Anaeramoeba flamelloides]